MLKKKLSAVLLCAFFPYLASSAASEIDGESFFEEAVMFEVQLQAIADSCAEPAFAEQFHLESKRQIIFALNELGGNGQQQGKILQFMAQMRADKNKTFSLENCRSYQPKIQALHESRSRALNHLQDVMQGLKQAN